MWHHRLQRRIRFSYWNELCVAKIFISELISYYTSK
jgi:hypothetical protein